MKHFVTFLLSKGALYLMSLALLPLMIEQSKNNFRWCVNLNLRNTLFIILEFDLLKQRKTENFFVASTD